MARAQLGPVSTAAETHPARWAREAQLRVVRRLLADGRYQDMADEMRRSGLARRYLGGFRSGWC